MSVTVYVWDRFIRFFHWSLAALFVTSYLTGENEHWIHPYSGYAIIGLLVARIAWGFRGSLHARFSDFVYPPTEVIAYLKALASGGQPRRYLGHNPAGGAMVLAMLVLLSGTTFSGLKLYAIEEGKGPLAAVELSLVPAAQADGGEESEEEEFWEELHELCINLMLLLVVLHLVGVALSSRAHSESLLRAMITGRKDAPGDGG